MQCCAHAQARPQKVLISDLWLTLKLHESRKRRLRQSCKLSAGALKVCLDTNKDQKTHGFEAFKEISVQSLADH